MEKMSNTNQRLVKNTLMLYFRMFFLIIVNLYTSRIVLNALGVNDFGIYNVIGGFVVMFGIVSGGLSHAVSRFLNIEMGRGSGIDALKSVFSSAAWIHIFFALAIVLVAEIVGPWFIENKMTIPIERLTAAKFVFQTSLFAFAVNLVSVPYNAVIIAHEHMNIYAYVSILEGSLKLILALLLGLMNSDKLIAYGFMMLCIAILIRVIFQLYCRKKYEESKMAFLFDWKLVKQMFVFSGWNMIGSSSVVLSNHGVNILLNIFCSPVVNAARGIAMQVSFAVTQFAQSFITALNPQITKNYGAQNYERYKNLILKGAKMSAIMLTFLALPIISETNLILQLWLKDVPSYSVNFVRLVLVLSVSESFTTPFVVGIMATGKIKWLQIFVGGTRMLNFPISFIMLKFFSKPEFVFVVAIVVSQATLLIEEKILKGYVTFSMMHFYLNSVLKLCVAVFPCFVACKFVSSFFPEGMLRLSVVVAIEWLIFGLIAWFFLLYRDERDMILKFVKKKKGSR